jgi:photosystem II stability/assembly factor-like uncharacterized protein
MEVITMPDLNADEVLTQKHKRNFIQYGGAKPGNEVQFAGQDAQYMSIQGVSVPEIGGIDPIWVQDPVRPGRFRLVGRSFSPQDLASATLAMREKHGAIPRQLLKNCTFNLYELSGKCANLTDFLNGWDDYVYIYSGAVVTDKDLGDRSSFDADDAIEDSLSLTLADAYPIGAISFGEGGASQIDREVIDLVYGPSKACDDCDFGDQRLYALVATSGAGSPGLAPEVVYTVNGGSAYSQINIDGMGANEVVYAIDIAGTKLIVIGEDAYYYATINQKTGVPGTFTKVTTGIVAAGSPKDLFVLSPREIFFVGDGGYIYKSTNIGNGVSVASAGDATAENLTRIHGSGETLVAVGENGIVVKSINRGRTWYAATALPSATLTLDAIGVLDADRYWVGSAWPAHMYQTVDGGESWTQFEFAGDNAGRITDIVWATNEVGYFLHSTDTPAARIWTTWNGGEDWGFNGDLDNRIKNWPTFDRGNRLAVPNIEDSGWKANSVSVGGLAGNGTDGILLVGVAGTL